MSKKRDQQDSQKNIKSWETTRVAESIYTLSIEYRTNQNFHIEKSRLTYILAWPEYFRVM